MVKGGIGNKLFVVRYGAQAECRLYATPFHCVADYERIGL